MSLHLSQQLRQSQRLVMTPQMQQSIALLQMNALELEQHLESELLENPFLEIGDNGEEEDQLVGEQVEKNDDAGEGREEAADTSPGEDADWEASLTGDNSDTLTASKSLEEMRDHDATGPREDTEVGAVAKVDNPLEVELCL